LGGLLTCNTVSQITYTVLAETLNHAQSISQSTSQNAMWKQTLLKQSSIKLI